MDDLEVFWDLVEKYPVFRPDPKVVKFVEALSKGELVESIDCGKLKKSFSTTYWHSNRAVIGFVSPTLELARGLKKVIGEGMVLEIGAGTGLLAKYLDAVGVDIVATDDYSWFDKDGFKWKPFFNVEKLDFKDAIRKYWADYLLMCWPKYAEPFAREAAELYHEINPEGLILFVGEGAGGCCGDDDFFKVVEEVEDLVEVNRVFPQWEGLHDWVWLFRWVGEKG